MRSVLVLSVAVACLALAAPVPKVPENFEDIPAEYKGLIPAEVAEHLKSITADDKTVLKELAKNYKDYKNEDDFMNALKAKSPSLYEKASKLQSLIKKKIDDLNDEARAFVKKAMDEGREIHMKYLQGNRPSLDTLKEVAKKHITAYKSLSQEAKDSIAEQFPILTGFLKNEKVKAAIEKYIN